MSHQFKNIENIYFDDGEAGKIGNAYIYNISFNQNYSASPSTLSINAISEDGIYTSVPSPNFNSVYTLKIGNSIIFRGYIISKEISTSENEKTASITMVDKSIVLDQYGIGLVNRHSVAPRGTKYISATARRANPLQDSYPDSTEIQFKRELSDTDVTGIIFSGNVFVIGREKWTSTDCDIPDVEYLQSHFDAVIDKFSSMVGVSFSEKPPIITGRNYTGTIREVLNSLCSDSGMSFYYDSTNDTVELFALDSKSIDDNIIENLKNDENITINNFTELESLEGTYANFFSVRQMRPGYGGISELNLECIDPKINLSAFNAPSGLPNVFYIDRAGMLSKISSGLRDRYCLEFGLYDRLGFVDVISLGYWSAMDPYLYSTNPDSPTSIDTFANYLGLPSEEVRQFFINNTQLWNCYSCAFDLYAVNIDEGLKNFYINQEEDSLDVHESWYEAIFSPDSLLYNANNSKGSCNVKTLTQEPEPTWQEPKNQKGFWGWKLGGDWDFTSDVDFSGFMADTRIAYMDITADINYTLGNVDQRSVLIFVPRGQFIGDITNGRWDSGAWSSYWLGNNYNSGYDSENCVPYLIARNTGKSETSPCGGKPCIDTTLERAFDDIITTPCSSYKLPTGEICQRERYGIIFSLPLNGGVQCTVALPWRSLVGFRSNIITTYVRNTSTETDPETIIKVSNHGINENNFAKLNINDVDATTEIFDPTSSNGNFIEPLSINTTIDSIFVNAQEVYKSFTKGSSSNGLPRSISVSLNGIPSNLDLALSLKSLKDWNINFGSNGISMNLNYSDAPSRPPSMDYLQSRLHNQFHYVTINGQ
jgi:hypothetical protein